MKRLLPLAICAALVPTATLAHPTGIAFDTRGECEAAYAASSKLDRERLVDMGLVDSQGAAQRTFKETFRCEYDADEDAWYIVFLGFPQQ